MTVDQLIDAVIDREGGYVNNPADRGGPTRWGITQGVARAQGYDGDLRILPRDEAVLIYRRLYWLRPGLDKVASRAPTIAAASFDTGVNMGPAVAIGFLQRSLNALNRGASDYPDIALDGVVGPATLAALDGFLTRRKPGGEAAAQGDRGTEGRALRRARRAATGRRGLPLRLAREPNGLTSPNFYHFKENDRCQ